MAADSPGRGNYLLGQTWSHEVENCESFCIANGSPLKDRIISIPSVEDALISLLLFSIKRIRDVIIDIASTVIWHIDTESAKLDIEKDVAINSFSDIRQPYSRVMSRNPFGTA